jgi:predicted neuraminidase
VALRALLGLATLVAIAVLLLAGCPSRPASDGAATGGLEFNIGGPPTPIQVEDQPIFQSEPVFQSLSGRVGSHAPTLTTFADGELLVAWYSYVGPSELDGAAIYTARRRPGAEGWEPPVLLVDRPESAANPVLYSEDEQVWLFYAVVPGGWSTAYVQVQRSADRGRTWPTANCIGGPLGTNVRHPPVRTADGSLLLPAYSDLLPRSLFFASHDGQTWALRSQLPTPLPHCNLQPSLAVLANGGLLAVMRNGGHGWLWVTVSEDDGQSWAPPIDSGFPNPDSPAALLGLADGCLVLIYNDSAVDRRPLSITISADQGATWHPPRVLADGDGAYAYPAAAQTPDGLVHVVYSHDRQRIQHLTLNQAWIVEQ